MRTVRHRPPANLSWNPATQGLLNPNPPFLSNRRVNNPERFQYGLHVAHLFWSPSAGSTGSPPQAAPHHPPQGRPGTPTADKSPPQQTAGHGFLTCARRGQEPGPASNGTGFKDKDRTAFERHPPNGAPRSRLQDLYLFGCEKPSARSRQRSSRLSCPRWPVFAPGWPSARHGSTSVSSGSAMQGAGSREVALCAATWQFLIILTCRGARGTYAGFRARRGRLISAGGIRAGWEAGSREIDLPVIAWLDRACCGAQVSCRGGQIAGAERWTRLFRATPSPRLSETSDARLPPGRPWENGPTEWLVRERNPR